MIAALYVLEHGVYFSEGFDPWDRARDARKYKGKHKVIAHPPCERWGRYWGGGPMLHGTKNQKLPFFWTRVLLFFKPIKVAVDLAPPGGDKSVKLFFKVLNGKIYILKEEIS